MFFDPSVLACLAGPWAEATEREQAHAAHGPRAVESGEQRGASDLRRHLTHLVLVIYIHLVTAECGDRSAEHLWRDFVQRPAACPMPAEL